MDSELEWHIQRVYPNLLKTGSRNLVWLIFKLKSWKEHLALQTFQQVSSMTSAHPGKMCVHFSELLFLKCSENAVFAFENTHNKTKKIKKNESKKKNCNYNCDNMGNTDKTVIHIPYFQSWSIFVYVFLDTLLNNILLLSKYYYWKVSW